MLATTQEKKLFSTIVKAALLVVAVAGVGSLIVFTPEGFKFTDLLVKLVDVTRGLVLVGLVLLVGWYLYTRARKAEKAMKARKGIAPLAILLVIIIVISIIGGYILLSTGNVAVGESSVIVNSWDGSVKPGPVGPVSRPGIISPGFESLVTIYTAVSSVHMCSGYTPELAENVALLQNGCDWGSPIGVTKDGIRLAIDVNVFWTVSTDGPKLVNLYKNYPHLDYEDRVIVPTVREVVRDVIVNRTFDEVFAERSVLPSLMADDIVQKVAHNPTLEGIIQVDPTSVQVLNIHMPQSIQDALQAKKNSEIAILTAQNNRNATIINADAQRLAAILEAQGAAQAKVIAANATQQAILTVVQSICPPTNSTCQSQASELYLTLLQLQQIAASSPNVIFIIGQGSNGQFFLIPLNTNSTA